MDVVTADGEFHTLDASSTGDEAKLWKAMRIAASSFGIVTKLTIKLQDTPPGKRMRFPIFNEFEEILPKLESDTKWGWLGMTRWDAVFGKSGSGWYLQPVLKDTSKETMEQFYNWTEAVGVQFVQEGVEYWPFDLVIENSADWGNFKSAGMLSRFYDQSEIKAVALRLHEFFKNGNTDCRYNLQFQGLERRPVVTLECNTPEQVEALKAFIEKHADELKPDAPGSGYINLPLDATSKYRYAYYPQYHELAAIKKIWDPEDFFNIQNGIHPE